MQEGLFNIIGCFSRGLHEYEAVLLSEPLSLLCADLSPGVEVRLVSDKHDRHVRVAVLSDFFEPPRQMGEGVPPRDVVHQKSSGCPAVVRTSDALERLLASSVPDLKLNVLFVDLDGAGAELDSDCQVMLLSEALVRKLEQQT